MIVMTDVLIRDLPDDVLALIRADAAEKGTSMQQQLHAVVLAHAAWLRRQTALASMKDRLQGRPAVTEEDRDAVLEAMKDESEITPVAPTHDR